MLDAQTGPDAAWGGQGLWRAARAAAQRRNVA